MSVLLLVVVLLVVAIVLSRLTWVSLGERRSIKHHEQAMDVLRSVAGRPLGSEHAEVGADGSAHVKSSVDDRSGFPAPAPPAREAVRAVPEATVQREETIRILRAEPTGATLPAPPPPPVQPVGSEPADEPVGVDARRGAGGSGPSWEPAHSLQSPSDGDAETAKPAFVFIADDTGQAGPVTVPPSVAESVRSGARGRWGNGDGHGNGDRGTPGGWGNGRRTTGGNGWADGERLGEEPDTGPTTLPRPPTIGDQDWSASSRSEARSRSRARTRSRLWGRVLAPVHATGRVASGARGRVGSVRRPVPPAADARPDDGGLTAVRDEPTDEDMKVMTADGTAVTTAPGPAVETTEGETPPSDSGQAEQPGLPFVQRARRGPRFGLAAGLAAIVVVACVVAGVLIATMSSSSNKAPQSRQARPPASAAPAPPPSPLTLVSHDDQGAVYNVNASQVSLSAVATGRVWMEVVSGTGPFGQVLWQGLLTQGQSQTVTNNAPVWVRIGAASNVNVSINGGGVLLPQSATTYNLTFSQA
ncbi:MAG TPA: DUF4115 domain-containing protein [Acidimicrobiales bacterium]|nr:DUF4115 domain-containing protein [Acidimicrobiales bacterium]